MLKAVADTAKRLWPFVQVSRIPQAWLRMMKICQIFDTCLCEYWISHYSLTASLHYLVEYKFSKNYHQNEYENEYLSSQTVFSLIFGFNNHVIAQSQENVPVKEFWKSVSIWRKYRHKVRGIFIYKLGDRQIDRWTGRTRNAAYVVKLWMLKDQPYISVWQKYPRSSLIKQIAKKAFNKSWLLFCLRLSTDPYIDVGLVWLPIIIIIVITQGVSCALWQIRT